MKQSRRDYTNISFAAVPTGFTKFWRGCILWQAWRFIVLNFKMIKIVVGGHS